MKKTILTICIIAATAMLWSSCGGGATNESSSSNEPSSNKVTINEASSNEVTIGTQVWMTSNLNIEKFRNGDPIPQVKTAAEWRKAGENHQPAWCYYANDSNNGEKYGKLYNWYAVNDKRGLAPKGYHVPSDEEWTTLTDYLGGEDKAGAKMKSKNGWAVDGNGTNSSGWSGLPGGFRSYKGTFYDIDRNGYWWSSSDHYTRNAWYRHLDYDFGKVRTNWNPTAYGYSVRCLRD